LKLYELTANFNEIFDLLDSDDTVDTQVLEDTLQSIEAAIEVKFGNVAKIIKTLEAEAAAFASEAKRLADKKTSTENKVKWLKNYLLQTLEQTAKDKIKTDIGTVRRQKNPASVDVIDVTLIPEEYFFTPVPVRQLVKDDLLKDLKAGENVPGAKLKQGYHIRIQ
jgi:hypothetical protein